MKSTPVTFMGGSGRDVRNEAFGREEPLRLLERQVARRDHEVRRGQVVVGEQLAVASNELPHLVEPPVQLRLVLCVDGRLRRVVELVQLLNELVGDSVLAFAAQPHDHDCSRSFGAPSSSRFSPPAASSPLRRARPPPDRGPGGVWGSSRSSWVPPEKSSSVPASTSSSTADARACICSVLSRARS